MHGNDGKFGGNCLDLAAYRVGRNGDEMIHSEIRALYDYWERLRGDRPCPYRAEVDPRDMAGDARHLFVIEDLGRGNMRFRLAGTALLDAFGYDLRGMSARSIMDGPARESFVALVSETLAEPGVGYARLIAPDGESVWEVILLPLRDNFGRVERVIGCLHPISGRTPEADGTALRFSIQDMSIQPVGVAPGDAGDAQPQAGFDAAQPNTLTAIEGGRGKSEQPERKRPHLKLVRSDDD